MSRPEVHEDHTLGLARPYVGRSSSASLGDVVEDPDITTEVGVRPYFLTGGRTRSRTESITFETVVVVAQMPSPYIESLRFEEKRLVELCREPQSIVEISAILHVPIAVARVLCGDLAAFGVLEIFTPPDDVTDDIALIDAVIHGLRQL
jgi:hypothetical protein